MISVFFTSGRLCWLTSPIVLFSWPFLYLRLSCPLYYWETFGGPRQPCRQRRKSQRLIPHTFTRPNSSRTGRRRQRPAVFSLHIHTSDHYIHIPCILRLLHTHSEPGLFLFCSKRQLCLFHITIKTTFICDTAERLCGARLPHSRRLPRRTTPRSSSHHYYPTLEEEEEKAWSEIDQASFDMIKTTRASGSLTTLHTNRLYNAKNF